MTAGRARLPAGTRRTAAALLAFTLFAVPQAGEASPVKLPDTALEPVAWSDLDGWAADDHAAAFATFMASCKTILRGSAKRRAARPMFGALRHVCHRAVEARPATAAAARAFFEANFRPVRIAPLGEVNGFLTGYYEPIVEGAREPGGPYATPLYRKPPNLLPGGRMMTTLPASIRKGRHAPKRKTVPFYDRAAIEDGVLADRDLEICYLKDPIDAFFSQIQGSVRVRLEDGKMLRLNYASQNGQPYTAVGRFLIERKHVAREDMSMARIRQWMEANPDEAKDIRRLNKSYVFFRETELSDDQEAVGAQGIPLTAGRSIAVDRKLHVYGTPFFIQADLPIDGTQPTTKFRRLMVAQDTGGAIVGPARADIYFGSGDRAGAISGRIRHPGKFVMLFPNEIDPAAATSTPLPKPRPAVAAKTDPKPDAKTSAPAADRASRNHRSHHHRRKHRR